MSSRVPTPFDLLSSGLLLVNHRREVMEVNLAAEDLFGSSAVVLRGTPLARLLAEPGRIGDLLVDAEQHEYRSRRLQVTWWPPGRPPTDLDTMVRLVNEGEVWVSIELREQDIALRIDREERQGALLQMNQSLLRNLGHEVKNPLGGIRGAAQLLDAELPTAALREYTQVIIKESDRLQSLVDQMLAPVRQAVERQPVNIHEVLERVRQLVLLEFPQGIGIRRDYDTSLPEILGDTEQLIQVVLNVTRNAAQALSEYGPNPVHAHAPCTITFQTRAVRQVTLHRRRHRLALQLRILDNGPGIPEPLRKEIFFPLVSGNPKGTGLGLTIAQTIVNQHGGLIECVSSPAGCEFQITLPLSPGELR